MAKHPSLALLKRAARLFPPRIADNLRAGVDDTRQIAHLVKPAPAALRLAFAPKATILVHPDFPSRYQAFGKLCARNGCRMIRDPSEDHDLAIHFQYHLDQARPSRRVTDKPTINGDCSTVSKRRVAEVFERVFGYALEVDPRSFDGDMVEKPDSNHTFEGRVLRGPLAAHEVRPGRVYERFVDTSHEGREQDLRTPIYGGHIPIVFEKSRPSGVGLKDVRDARMREVQEIFTPGEIRKLQQFAAAMNLDYGELDVLRDRSDGRIYVVDVNNTPAGPPKQMTDRQISVALNLLSPAFMRLIYRFKNMPGARE